LTDLKLFLSHSGLDATLSISVQTSLEGHFSALRHHITVFNTSTPHDRTTKHQLQARNSCVADARSYRVARRLPVPAAAPFDWKALIPVKWLSKIGSTWLKKFRD
jgi:hypothetical protein